MHNFVRTNSEFSINGIGPLTLLHDICDKIHTMLYRRNGYCYNSRVSFVMVCCKRKKHCDIMAKTKNERNT